MLFKQVVWGVLVVASALFSYSSYAATYEYDPLGRLTKVIYTDGKIVEYKYDAAGNRTQHIVDITAESPINDSIPTLGTGSNLLDLSGWPVGDAPAGSATVLNWNDIYTFGNEARWSRVAGPGESHQVTAMEAGQTEPDAGGGGAAFTNYFTIDKTKAYEFSLYFRKHDLAVQNLYFGLSQSGLVRSMGNSNVNTNPYFVVMSLGSQAASLDASKWYKVVGYVFPEGYMGQAGDPTGGLYDVETGTRIAAAVNFRWNELSSAPQAHARFFTYYSEAQQNRYTTYFYQPEVKVTSISYTPVVPNISVSHVDATEGSNVTYTVSLSQATTVDVKVNYTVGNGTADSNDYTATSGTLTFAPGETSKAVSVVTVPDSLLEASETVILTLSSPVRANIASGETTETATINNNSQTSSVTFSVNDPTVTEGGTLSFIVTKSGSTALSHAVSYVTDNNTAAVGSDYTYAGGTLTFASGETSKTVTVTTTSDSIYESNETVNLNLSSATNGASISDLQGIGTITNNDSAPSFSINNVSVAEGGNLSFTVSKSGLTDRSHNISYATSNGTAMAGSDYTTKSGTLTFTSAQVSQTVTVATSGDSVYENNETVNLNLSSATASATISDAQGVGTISNTTASPSFSVNDVSVTEGGTLTYTVTKSGSTTLSHSVSYATSSPGAVGWPSPGDYTSASGTLSFTSGQTSKTVSVSTTQDTLVEPDERVILNLSNATNGASISDAAGYGTIVNDDQSNSPPVANNDSYSTTVLASNTYFYPLNNDTDSDGNTLHISSLSGASSSNCSIIVPGGSASLSCMFTAAGTYYVTYTVSDGYDTDTATITFTVTGGGGFPGGGGGPGNT